ncbi:MAG TPA: DMT family transporter [Methylobacterium sp.]|jgi:transporter family-2 protein
MWYLTAVAMLAGIANAVQPGMNATFGKSLAMPVAGGIFSLLSSAAIAALVGLATGYLHWPDSASFRGIPWWAWGGGVFGALLVVAQVFVAPALGATLYLGIIVTVGVVTSLALDHFGLVGFEPHAAGLWRILGGVLMIAGVALVAIF